MCVGSREHALGSSAFSSPTRFLSTLGHLLRSRRAAARSIRSGFLQRRQLESKSPLVEQRADMTTVDNGNSAIANTDIEVIQNVMISRYFTAAGLVVVMYDTILTIEDEVSGYLIKALELRSLSGDPSGLARASRNSEGTLLHQPVLDGCDLTSWQLPCVAMPNASFEGLTLGKTWLGFDHRFRPM